MRLAEIIAALESLAVDWTAALKRWGQVEVTGLAYDSRKVKPGQAFFALKGAAADGHQFISQALEQGASAVIGQEPDPDGVAYVRVYDSRLALARAAHHFFGQPCQKLEMVGITGTSGKTTTSYALESILEAAGRRAGVVGTVNYRFGGRSRPAPVTTPESLDLVLLLNEMLAAGVETVAMEVSSHALDQGRVTGCRFEAACFTNLSRDHLDYHLDMEAYFQAKRRLFTELPVKSRAVNLDDPYGRRLKEELGSEALTFGLSSSSDVTAEGLHLNGRGLQARIITPSGSFELASPLLGRFNISNFLAATALAWLLGLETEAVAEGLNRLEVVPGRMEDVGRSFGRRVIVDYSHKVEALDRALEAAREITPGRLLTVFGCGGDRDRGKRPLMAAAAAAKSDIVIVTSDNPRSEDPLAIMAQVAAGFEGGPLAQLPPEASRLPEGSGYYTLVADRRAAIRMAVQAAGEEDTVMICGKGHEDYQIIGQERRHLDDREEALLALKELAGEA